MKRILCLWLPDWPVQRRIVAQPELDGRPLVLHARDPRRGECVKACSAQARRVGVRPRMPLAEASAMLGAKHDGDKTQQLLPYDAAADREALAHLAEHCERFSPLVGLEQRDEPECLLLDVTRLGPLFGGEEALAQAVVDDFRDRGYRVRIGVAHTIGAAWAAARFSISDFRLQIPDCQPSSLSAASLASSNLQSEICNLKSLPIAALRLSDATLTLLERLGIERIEQLLELPRASLSSRFPPGDSGRCLLLERLDQFTGQLDELIVPHRPPPEFEAAWHLEHPTERRDALETIVRQLLERVAEALLARGRGALRLDGRIDCAGGPPLLLQVGLYRPTADARHLLELVGMQFERLALPGAVGRVGMQVTLAAPLAQQQGELFAAAGRDAPRHLAVLVDRLSSRLGRQAVLRPRLQADAQPERACRYQALTGKLRKRARGRTAAPRFAAAERPLQLLSPAEAIETVAVVPDGPPIRFHWRRRDYRVARHWGPERIETGWWRGRSVQRDYYRVETTDGQRYWLFRRLDNGRWLLHGVFV
ncbi:MAG: hypothetical protein RIC55_04165 [Pirellulaceae bacterium]